MLKDTNYQLWRNKMKDLRFVKALRTFLFLLLKNPSRKLMKSGNLSINRCAILFGNWLKRMFIITLIKRHMWSHRGKSLKNCMRRSPTIISCSCLREWLCWLTRKKFLQPTNWMSFKVCWLNYNRMISLICTKTIFFSQERCNKISLISFFISSINMHSKQTWV